MPGEKADRLLIYADHRERGAGVIAGLEAYADVRIEIRQLSVADYVLSEKVAVERKTVGDLVQSILDKRLFAQAERLLAGYGQPLLIVEGRELYGRAGVHPNAIRGALSYVAVIKGIPVLRTVDAEDTAAYLHVMARHAQQGLGYELSLFAKRKATNISQQQRYVLEALPGIGPALARALLRHFGSLAEIFAADERALQGVPGIGKATARKIREIAGRRYREPSSG